MTFVVVFADSAVEDLGSLKKHEQALVVDAVEQQLLHEPNVETRNRKELEPNPLAGWELRIGPYRVFYDLETQRRIVTTKAVGWKEHSRLYIRGREYHL